MRLELMGNGWYNFTLYEWINEWTDEWINECMNKSMTDWKNEPFSFFFSFSWVRETLGWNDGPEHAISSREENTFFLLNSNDGLNVADKIYTSHSDPCLCENLLISHI